MKTRLIILLVIAFTMSFATAESHTSLDGESTYIEDISSIRSSTSDFYLAMADNSDHGAYKMVKCWTKNDPYQDDDLYDDSFDDDND